MLVEGIRVIRGPDWSDDDTDGGEGHAGTITQDNQDDTVEVQWDMGESGEYKTGKDGKCELRILDSGPIGLQHDGVTCDGCQTAPFSGTRWKCSDCPDFDLCTPCYAKDVHSLTHRFKRMDAPGMPGDLVAKRSTSSKMQALGLFPGAKAKRGEDWNSGNQDGGSGKIGTVGQVKNYGTDGRERDAVTVTWPNKESNTYRVGYRGKMDLQCVEETRGMGYYRDHLFPLSTTGVPRTSASYSTTSVPKRSSVRQKPPLAPKPREALQIGDKVCVELPELKLKDAQRGHGGWSLRMKDYIGQIGILKRFEDNGDCVINYDGKEWRFNREAVKKIPTLHVGDIIRILDDSEKVQALQKRHGGWQSDMEAVLGKAGKVVKIDSDGDIAVAFGARAWVFNPACCEAATGAKVFEQEADDGKRKARASGGSDTADDDGDGDEGDEAAEALARLVAQMFLFQGQRSGVGAQQFISAAANNRVEEVKALIAKRKDIVNEKFKGLTALIISSHEGHVGVVKVLIAAKADLNAREEKGNTALMAALMKKREDCAMLLMEAGANIHLLSIPKRNALHCAATNGANSSIKELLKRGCDPNQQDADGDTPLHDAITAKENTAVSFLLMDSRINLKLCNRKGFVAFHLAAMRDDEMAVAAILRKMPSLLNACKPSDGYTALHIAAINDNAGVAKVLLKANAEVNPVNVKKYTPLHLSCHQGYINISKILLENSADVHAKDDDGDTPLHNVMSGSRNSQGNDPLARLLGLRVTSEGEIKERTNLACLLIQQGASTKVRNRKAKTPIECCGFEKLRNAVSMFAQSHERQSGGGGGGGGGASRGAQGGAALLADLFGLMQVPCMGCMQKLADARFMPCGHKVCCQRCSVQIQECPMCDQPVQDRFDMAGRRIVLVDPCKVQ